MIKETIGGSLIIFLFLLAYYIFYYIPKVEPIVWERKIKRKELMLTNDFKDYIRDCVQKGIKKKELTESLRLEGIYDYWFVRKLYKKSMEEMKHERKNANIQGKNGRRKEKKGTGKGRRSWFGRRNKTEGRDNIADTGTTTKE